MAARFYDEELSPALLRVLKKRDVLGQSKPGHFVPLVYNVRMEVEHMEQDFDAERKGNPLLETTPPEAWLAAEFTTIINTIRANVEIDDRVLVATLKRYFLLAVPLIANKAQGEQQLWTTIEPYRTVMQKLLLDLCDRRKSLRGILRIRAGVCSVREGTSELKPGSKREAILLQGITGRWTNQHIAAELDKHSVKPRSDEYKSYTEMFRMGPQGFYAMKSDVKRKYRINLSNRVSSRKPQA
jgi:hypothetical protein